VIRLDRDDLALVSFHIIGSHKIACETWAPIQHSPSSSPHVGNPIELQASFQRFGVGAERTSRSDISDRGFHLFDGGDRLFEWIAT
jgi:hypothetical protein